jgi:hypothetical protein
MKKLLLFFAILLFAACKEEAQVTPETPLTGTTWTSYRFGVPGQVSDEDGLYQVLQFTSGQKVRIDYKINGAVYFPVGKFDYQFQGSKFWVLNADGTRTDGNYDESGMVFGGERFVKEGI